MVCSSPRENPREVLSMQPIAISEDSLEESSVESEGQEEQEEPPILPKTRKRKVCGTPSPSKDGFCTQTYGHLGPCFSLPERKRRGA